MIKSNKAVIVDITAFLLYNNFDNLLKEVKQLTLFERKAIEWLRSLDNPRNPTDEGYYAQLILAMLEGLDEQSVSDLLSRINDLEGEVERLKDILDDVGAVYREYEM